MICVCCRILLKSKWMTHLVRTHYMAILSHWGGMMIMICAYRELAVKLIL